MIMDRSEYKYLFTEDTTQVGDKIRSDFFQLTQKNSKRNVCFTVLYFLIGGTNIDKYLKIDTISKPTFASSIAAFVYVKLNNGVYQSIFNENDKVNTNRSITNILASINIPNNINVIELIDLLIYLLEANSALTNEIKEKKVSAFNELRNILINDSNGIREKISIRENVVDKSVKYDELFYPSNETCEKTYKNNNEEDDISKEITIINKIGNEPLNISEEKSMITTKQGNMVYIASSRGIYKFPCDGNYIKKVYDGEAKFLNVVGEWIYFVNYKSIYKIKLNGKDKKELFNLEKHTGLKNCYFQSLIVVGDNIFFSIAIWDKGKSPFVASINCNGKNITYYYTLDKRYLDDENRISILGAGEKYLYCQVSSLENFPFIIDTSVSSVFHLCERLDYKKILNRYPDEDETEDEIWEQFERSIKYIDFSDGWVYLKNYLIDGYTYLRIKLDGSELQPIWSEADWSEMHNGPGVPCIEARYFNGKIDIGFANGNIVRRYPNGKVTNLHGEVEIPGKHTLHISGDYAYWGDYFFRRININTGVEEEIDFEKLTLRKV